MKALIYSLLLILPGIGCKPSSGNGTPADAAAEAKALEDKVMAIHDSTMTRMGEINDINTQLRDIRSNLKENETGKLDIPDGLDQTIESLKLAEQGMWDWMKLYNDTKPTVTEDQMKSFMQHQLEIISKVQLDINTSIDKAKTWLAANPPKQ